MKKIFKKMIPIFKKMIPCILKFEARLVLWKYKPKIIAITGSIGKTSTKDAIYAVSSKFLNIRKSEKSYNSEIGLPLTILGCESAWNNVLGWLKIFFKGLKLLFLKYDYPEWLILEAGIRKPGDMLKSTNWFSSDIVVITAIGETPPHIEFFNSLENLVAEKKLLVNTLKNYNNYGILILNFDYPASFSMKNNKFRTITFGFKKGADVLGSNENVFYEENNEIFPTGITFKIDMDGKSIPIKIKNSLGKNNIYSALAALAVCSAMKLNLLKAIDALKDYDIPFGRMRLLKGLNESLIIDDTYNSSPPACESALKTLGSIESRGCIRKIAVLGDMLELGKDTEMTHKKIGQMAYNNCDILITVGQRSQDIKIGAISSGMDIEKIFEFQDSKSAGEFLKTFIKKNNLILIKGSQSMRMERSVKIILSNPKDKQFLVRQEPEWLKR